ncbi:ABC transporter permease/substrate-binding protein [Sphingomonas sp. ID0503]|uniref:ABC transporter permease/substrate-binding protein n=1 Tax=Sphingomonas sp. ID0503 TaxID=3399691 RepID=UPI003AFAD30A
MMTAGELIPAMRELMPLLRAHVLLSGLSVGTALTIGLPLAVFASDRPRLRGPLLAGAGLLQTVPGLALLALLYPLLLLLGQATGLAIPALGFLPAFIALTLYALLPVMRNGVAAMQEVDPALREAAASLGAGRLQQILMVELPLAGPVILAGIRTATVWTIGTATLATTIGQPSLGNLIFSGLQLEDWRRVLIGCAASAALAILADGLLGAVESGLARGSRRRAWAGVGLIAAGLVVALAPAPARGGRVVVIGAKNFSEQYILASLIEARLRAAGFATERRDDLGSAIAYRATAGGDVDVYVDYAGTLSANVLGRRGRVPVAELSRALAARDGVRVLGGLGFENAYAFAMRRDRAEALGIRTLDDLARAARKLRLASDLEFLSRPEWRAVERVYGMRFAEARPYSPTFMYRALASGAADVISAFSSDGRIAAMDLVTPEDRRGALPGYEALLLMSPGAGRDAAVVAALRPLIGAISVERMRAANLMVDRDADKRSPAEAAGWLGGMIRSSHLHRRALRAATP